VLTAAAAPEEDAREPVAARTGLWRRAASTFAKALTGVVLAVLLAVGALGLLLDTDFGHRLILDRIAAIAPDSGLRIRIGRIEGSIWGRTELRDVRLYDPDGLFAEAPELELEWQPLAWLWNRLVIDEAASPLVIVHRAPALIEADDGPSLPRFDFHLGRLDVAQVRFEEPVAGTRRVASVSGEAEYRRGRFLVDLDATMRGGGDRLSLLVDSAPERDEFDLDLELDAPAGGVLARLLGTEAPLRIAASGDGGWRRWTGTATLDIGGRRSGEARLGAASGLLRANGWIAPAPLLQGTLARLGGARTMVSLEGRIEDGVASGRLAARSAAMRFAAGGGADLRERAYRDVGIVFELLGPSPLLAGVAAPGARATALLDGPFRDARLAYRATAPRIVLGGVSLEAVTASGGGRWTRGALALPVVASVGRVVGAGEANRAALAGLRIEGPLRADEGQIRSDSLRFTARGISGRMALQADLGTGRYVLAATAAAQAYPLPGVGPADIQAQLRAASGAALAGSARGIVRRIDNAALAWAAGGPLRIETGIAGGGNGLLFPGMRLSAPSLRLAGNGAAGADGAFRFEGSGRQGALGPLALRLQGIAGRPLLALRLAAPARSLGLADVTLQVAPAGGGFAYRASGGSPLGRFSARGAIRSLRNRSAAIDVADLAVSGADASGALRIDSAGLSGSLGFSGALAGPVTLGADGAGQRIEADLVATDARLGRVPVGSGRIAAALRVGGDGGALEGRVRFTGVADRLWALTGADAVRLSGPLALEADVGGTLAEPLLRGTVRLAGGRVVAGARTVENLDARGTFDRARLQLESVTGRMSGGGRIEASGTVGFDGALALRVAGQRIEIDERGLDSRWNAALRVGGSVDAPAVFGEATLVDGTYRVLGRPIELSRGTMRFEGERPPDPRLDLVASPPVGPAIRITGRASRPVIGVVNPLSGSD
jgi:translocation and assembly module TamB